MKKKKKKGLFSLLIFIVSFLGMIYCGYRLYLLYLDYHTSDIEYNTLISDYVEEIPDDEYEYLQIDWAALQRVNPDIVGWIRIPDTVVNYPIVKGDSNEKYLNKTFEGKTATAGAIFLDYRNNSEFTDYISVIYGHNMKNKSMFSVLREYLKPEFLESHKSIEIYTPYWAKVYSPSYVYTAHYTDGVYEFMMDNQDEYVDWLKARNKSSKYKKEPDATQNSIVLSTCYGKHGTENRCVVIIQPDTEVEPIY